MWHWGLCYVYLANIVEGFGVIERPHRHDVTFCLDQVIEQAASALRAEKPFRPVRRLVTRHVFAADEPHRPHRPGQPGTAGRALAHGVMADVMVGFNGAT